MRSTASAAVSQRHDYGKGTSYETAMGRTTPTHGNCVRRLHVLLTDMYNALYFIFPTEKNDMQLKRWITHSTSHSVYLNRCQCDKIQNIINMSCVQAPICWTTTQAISVKTFLPLETLPSLTWAAWLQEQWPCVTVGATR